VPVMCNDDFGLTCAGANVCFDFNKGGYLATKHLIECGHTRIGCVSGPPNYRVSLARLNGYKAALKDAGLPFNQSLVFQADYTMRGASQALAYLLGQSATAIFSFNDEMAFALYQSARQYEVNIPRDISIIGCDNVPFSDVLEVPLSTIHVPTEEMGKVLAQELIACIKNGGPCERKTIWYEPALILRGSISRHI
jgi:LacI family transcriptional regulator